MLLFSHGLDVDQKVKNVLSNHLRNSVAIRKLHIYVVRQTNIQRISSIYFVLADTDFISSEWTIFSIICSTFAKCSDSITKFVCSLYTE